jgi:hypothetical protein
LADEEKEVNEPKQSEPEAGGSETTELVGQAVKDLQGKVTGLETEVASKTQEINELKKINELTESNFEAAKAAFAYAVEDYKKLAASANPLVPADVISGATIEEVKDSLDRALKLVSNVQSSLQEGLTRQAQASAVPAGAPARTGLDASAMTTREKINYGLEQARKKKE